MLGKIEAYVLGFLFALVTGSVGYAAGHWIGYGDRKEEEKLENAATTGFTEAQKQFITSAATQQNAVWDEKFKVFSSVLPGLVRNAQKPIEIKAVFDPKCIAEQAVVEETNAHRH